VNLANISTESSTGQRPVLRDAVGRQIDYLRISVTDRCDLRCRYCMAERMQFLPRSELLTLEELALIADRFIARGIRRIRLTGGEPLVRRDVPELARRIGRHLTVGTLDELTLTTNGTQLARHAETLADAGIRRINVSLDTLDSEAFHTLTRGGNLADVLDGIKAAKTSGLHVKINMVALRGINQDQLLPMLHWCAGEGHDLTLIETMPLGDTGEDRTAHHLPLPEMLAPVREIYPVESIPHRTGGPARYFKVGNLPVKLGQITPLSDNFCASCNRMRLTCTGRIYMCLGHEDHIDLKAALRDEGIDRVDALLDRALAAKPARHDFSITSGGAPATVRHMSVTGG
jgi:GTP 3',8-cyclase